MKFNNHYILALRDEAIKRALNLKVEVYQEESISKNSKGTSLKDNTIFGNYIKKDYFVVKNLFTKNEWENIVKKKYHTVLGKAFYFECIDNYQDIIVPIDRGKRPQRYKLGKLYFTYRSIYNINNI